MRRLLFNLAAAVSALLCLATAALWVRSHTYLDIVVFTSPLDSNDAQMLRASPPTAACCCTPINTFL